MINNSYKNPTILGADFETDITDDGSRRFVCQWAISPGHDFPEGGHPFAWTGKDLESFEKTLRNIQSYNHHVLIYFHNLPYDASYMMELLNDIPDWGFTPFYAVQQNEPIVVSFTKGDAKKPTESIVFRDSHKKLSNSLKEIGEMLGYEKLMAPDSEFTPGWSKSLDYEHTKYSDSDWVYVSMDAWICCRAMKMLHEGFDGKKFDRPTFSGDAYINCKKSVNGGNATRNAKKFHTNKTKWERLFPPLPTYDLDEDGEVILPDDYASFVGDDKVTDNEIRQAYWGGINYSAHKGLNVPENRTKIFHIDYHSMYPSQMKYRLLPYGKCVDVLDISGGYPVECHDDYDYDPECMVYVCEIFVTKMKLKEGRNPWYHLRNDVERREEGLGSSDPVVELKHPHLITTCSVELEDLREFYDIETAPRLTKEFLEDHEEYSDDWFPQAWVFMAKEGILADYIDYWYGMKQKEESEGRKGGLWYNWAKVMMNSVYGRMAMNRYQMETVIEWNPNIQWFDWKKTVRKPANNWEGYIPYSVFICAWARHQLLDAWIKVGCENVIHSDTDSIIFFGERMPDDLIVTGHTDEVSVSELDTWGNECPTKTEDGYEDVDGSTIIALYEGGTKRYIEVVRPLDEFKPGDKLKNFVHTAMAGVPQKTFKTPEGTQYPIGMWIELLDDPERICETDENGEPITLGNSHYTIETGWLRELYEKLGLNPDDVNTMKKARHKMCGGMDIVDTTFKLNSGYRLAFR